MADAEEAVRQEQGLRDLAARQEVEEARARAVEGEGDDEERDLDEDIPDADADAEGDNAGDDSDQGSEEEVLEEEVTFNESSVVGGSRVGMDIGTERYAAIEEAELTGAAREMEELGLQREMEMERDLDDSVPDAGSYQHTDTEVEDSSSEEESELDDSFAGRQLQQAQSVTTSGRRSTRSSTSAQRSIQQMPQLQGARIGGLQDRIRAQVVTPVNDRAEGGLPRSPGSLNLSSSLVESSFVGSSPVAQRGARGRASGRRRGRVS